MECSPLIIVLKKKEKTQHKVYKHNTSHTCFLTFPLPLSMQHLSSVKKSRDSPVVKVHDSLDGIPSTSGDVSLEAGKQRGDHVHTVFLTLPVSEDT